MFCCPKPQASKCLYFMTTTLQLRQVSNILAVLTGHVGFPLHAKLSRHQRVKCSIEPIQLTLKHIFLQQVSGERHLNSGCSMETYSQEYGVQQHSNPHHLWLCLTQSKRNDNGNPTLHLLVFCCNFRSALLASSVSPGIVAILKGLICHPHIIRSEY